MKPYRLILAACCFTAALTACESTNSNSFDLIPREDIPLNTSQKQIAQVLITEFGKNVFQSVVENDPSSNIVFSPISLSFNIGMLTNGADGSTLGQLHSATGFTQFNHTDADINTIYKTLLSTLSKLDNSADLNIANALWFKSAYQNTMEKSTLSLISHEFNAEINGIDSFDTDNFVKYANSWIERNTNGMIKNFIEEPLSSNCAMVISNALYFKGLWTIPFNPAETQDDRFTNFNGTTSSVRMMSQEATISHFEANNYIACRLPFGNKAFSFIAMLPNETSSCEDVLNSLDGKTIFKYAKEDGNIEYITIQLPKFECNSKLNLIPHLMDMGITDIFDISSADLSKFNSSAPLYISSLKQGCAISIDETGAKFASVTTSGLDTALPSLKKIVFNRPFVFIIAEYSTGIPLCMGVIRSL